MKALTRFCLLIAPFAGLALAQTVTFSDSETGRSPAGWTVDLTGEGEPKWTVELDDSAPSRPAVLRQSGVVPKPSFPLCVKDTPALANGFVETRFKTVSGQIDQAAGVVWRFQDRNNYYVCRANALEDNVVLYRVRQGKRESLEIVGRTGGYGVDARVTPQSWHTLRVQFADRRARVSLDGLQLFEVEDATFTEAGRVGLWTKADSVTLFDDFQCGVE